MMREKSVVESERYRERRGRERLERRKGKGEREGGLKMREESNSRKQSSYYLSLSEPASERITPIAIA